MPENRYKQDMILRGLRIVVKEVTGKDAPLFANTRIDLHMTRLGLWEDLDALDLSFRIEMFFQCRFDRDDWQELAQGRPEMSRKEWEAIYAHEFTFGRLAAILAPRVKVVTIEPSMIIGKPCLPAGAFETLEGLARRVRPNAPKFGPSTPMRSVFNNRELKRFWTLVRWISRDRVPPIGRQGTGLANEGTRSWICYILLAAGLDLFAMAPALMMTGQLGDFSEVRFYATHLWKPLALVSALGVAAFLLIFGRRLRMPRMATFELPDGVETFGDLSRGLALLHRGFCGNCSYNFMGVDGSQCPGCGASIPTSCDKSAIPA